MKWLKRYMPAYLHLAVPAWICLLVEVLVDLSLPTLIASIINEGIEKRNPDHILRTGGLMLSLALLGSLFGIARNWLSTHASQNLGTSIRGELFRKTQAISLAINRQIGAASLITRLTNDVMQVQNLSYLLMRIFIRAPLMLIGGILMAALLNPQMAMILIAVLPLLGILIYIRVKRGFPLFRRVQGSIDRVNGVLREYLAGVREVKVFNRFAYESDRFDQANRNLTGLGIQAARSMATIQPLIYILMNGSIILLLWMGGSRVAGGQTQVGDIVAFINYFLQILQAMTLLSMIFTLGVRAKTSIDRIGQVFALPDDMPPAEHPATAPVTGTLAMRQVSFTYPGQTRPILQQISFRIQSGQTAAIIGSTGCGKTTLINLLFRFYDADAGMILVDEVPVRDMELGDLRGRIALVPQQSLLFSGTLAENLRWGKPDATDDELWQAVEIAQAADFIRLMPDGLQTRIGQSGVNLSGGQKQRLCIARALIRKTAVLILDDSTSAIDMATEQRLRSALKEHCRGLTVMMIAQRIHSVMEADTILVMDNGRLIRQGTHRELLLDCPIYRDIYRSQIGLDPDGREVV
ncbi:MAG: ABC transporter ATP-binding protein [Clostridiaceae bacterium]|nr:ABC transporter ATP-binding protein [Clostridiaceae bacterium]